MSHTTSAKDNIISAFESKGDNMSNRIPKTAQEFIECCDLVDFNPRVYDGLVYLAREFDTWKNILELFEELYVVAKQSPHDFKRFLDSIVCIPWGNMNQTDHIKLRNDGEALYNKHFFCGKSIPNLNLVFHRG